VDNCRSISLHAPSSTAFLACDHLYTYHYLSNTLQRLDLPLNSTGISTVQVDDTTLVVMTIHASTVEIYAHTLGTTVIEHVETVQNPLIYSPNAILALDKTRFYLVNSHRFTDGVLHSLESILPLPLSNVVYRDSKGKLSIVADGLRNANGIAMTPDNVVYVSEGTGNGIAFYERVKNGKLRHIYHQHTGMKVHHLYADATSGAVYGAASPKLLDPLFSTIFRVANNTDEDLFFGAKYKAKEVVRLTRQITAAASDESKNVVLLGTSEGLMQCTL
jgi:hypothetical protein